MTAAPPTSTHRRSLLSGALVGAGFAAVVDEVVFHQLLAWHHFYDRASLRVGLLSDGLLHAFSYTATVTGLFLLADLRRRGALAWQPWVGAVLLGFGAFQLFDGVVDHKLLRVHQVRYGVELLPYDAAWIGAAVASLVAGAIVLRRARARASSAAAR